MDPQVIHIAPSYVIVNKPSGWITNSSSTTTNQPVLQDWIRKNLAFPISMSIEFRSGIVHRLDKETSGILIIAKTESSFRQLQKQFKDRIVSKTYVALAHGAIEPSLGTIDVPVGRLPWRRDRFGVLPGGRSSITTYKVLEIIKSKRELFSLVEIYPKTGRTHQLRIHLKHINHPIVSDNFYAGRKTARNDRKWCPRLFLHAKGINFADPETREVVSYESQLPVDLSSVIDRMKS